MPSPRRLHTPVDPTMRRVVLAVFTDVPVVGLKARLAALRLGKLSRCDAVGVLCSPFVEWHALVAEYLRHDAGFSHAQLRELVEEVAVVVGAHPVRVEDLPDAGEELEEARTRTGTRASMKKRRTRTTRVDTEFGGWRARRGGGGPADGDESDVDSTAGAKKDMSDSELGIVTATHDHQWQQLCASSAPRCSADAQLSTCWSTTPSRSLSSTSRSSLRLHRTRVDFYVSYATEDDYVAAATVASYAVPDPDSEAIMKKEDTEFAEFRTGGGGAETRRNLVKVDTHHLELVPAAPKRAPCGCGTRNYMHYTRFPISYTALSPAVTSSLALIEPGITWHARPHIVASDGSLCPLFSLPSHHVEGNMSCWPIAPLRTEVQNVARTELVCRDPWARSEARCYGSQWGFTVGVGLCASLQDREVWPAGSTLPLHIRSPAPRFLPPVSTRLDLPLAARSFYQADMMIPDVSVRGMSCIRTRGHPYPGVARLSPESPKLPPMSAAAHRAEKHVSFVHVYTRLGQETGPRLRLLSAEQLAWRRMLRRRPRGDLRYLEMVVRLTFVVTSQSAPPAFVRGVSVLTDKHRVLTLLIEADTPRVLGHEASVEKIAQASLTEEVDSNDATYVKLIFCAVLEEDNFKLNTPKLKQAVSEASWISRKHDSSS
ncbi:hypothetical protein B0H10DRAFT_1953607 [Mycena sp. CBHHK59/15]|nr:hypothetical protein B0H10DRAFT_1953607 [Mycena sp. CBHHK59/15]